MYILNRAFHPVKNSSNKRPERVYPGVTQGQEAWWFGVCVGESRLAWHSGRGLLAHQASALAICHWRHMFKSWHTFLANCLLGSGCVSLPSTLSLPLPACLPPSLLEAPPNISVAGNLPSGIAGVCHQA